MKLNDGRYDRYLHMFNNSWAEVSNEAFQRGIRNAIETVTWLFRNVPDEKLFDGNGVEDILNLYSYDSIVKGINAYKKKLETESFRIGDEVYTSKDKDGNYLDVGIVTALGVGVHEDWPVVMSRNGRNYTSDHQKQIWHKTGRHFAGFQQILDAIGVETEPPTFNLLVQGVKKHVSDFSDLEDET